MEIKGYKSSSEQSVHVRWPTRFTQNSSGIIEICTHCTKQIQVSCMYNNSIEMVNIHLCVNLIKHFHVIHEI